MREPKGWKRREVRAVVVEMDVGCGPATVEVEEMVVGAVGMNMEVWVVVVVVEMRLLGFHGLLVAWALFRRLSPRGTHLNPNGTWFSAIN